MFEDDKLLRIPGPTPVPDRIVKAIAKPMIGHRSSQFADVFAEVEEQLKGLFETTAAVFVLAGSGTVGMESAVANLLDPGEACLVAAGGKFGERWVEITEAFGAKPVVIEYPYGQGLEPAAVVRAIEATPAARVLFITQNESSTGVFNDVQALAAEARARGLLTVVDAVSSLGGAPLPMDDWQVDVVVTGSQKCLMLPPGLSFVAVGERARSKAETTTNHRYYVDWRKYEASLQKSQTPYTPAVSLVVGLRESLAMLAEEGASARHARHRLMRDMIRAGLKRLGFDMFVEDRWASPTVTAAASDEIDPEALRKAVRVRTGMTLSGGQGDLKGRLLRVGHMGALTPLDMVATMGAIELGMADLGHPPTFGLGVGAAVEVWEACR